MTVVFKEETATAIAYIKAPAPFRQAASEAQFCHCMRGKAMLRLSDSPVFVSNHEYPQVMEFCLKEISKQGHYMFPSLTSSIEFLLLLPQNYKVNKT